MSTYLTDTNILLRLVHKSDPNHKLVADVVRRLLLEEHSLVVASQNIVEFWNVTTRPVNRNGFGRSPHEASALLDDLEILFTLLPDTPDIYPLWRQLVINHGVSGVQVHDARLAATMLAHKIPNLLTFNTRDFARYTPAGIVAVDPATLGF